MGSSTCYFTNCCFCIPLKTGCFILGYIDLVRGILALIGSVVAIAVGAVMSNDPKHQENSVVVIVAGVILLIMMLVSLAFTITLLVGLHKDKPGHVKAFLIYNIVVLVIFMILIISSWILLFIMSVEAGVSAVISGIIQLVLSIHFMLVFRNQYIDMTKGINRTV